MKSMSESLEALAARVKVLEDSATATFEADRANLEKRRHEIDEAFKTDVSEFESAVRKAAEAGRTWWNETKAAMKRPLDEVRARVEKRQSEHELHRALRHRGRGRGRRGCRHRGRRILPRRRRVRRHRRCARPHGRRRPRRRRAGLGHRSDVMMRPYVGSWKRLAVHGVGCGVLRPGRAGVAGHHAPRPGPAVGCVRPRRRHHRAVGRDQ